MTEGEYTERFVSANENLGAHLLGRIPAQDDRDWSLEDVLAGSALAQAFAKVEAAGTINPAAKAWIEAAQPLLVGLVPPGPVPPAPPTPPTPPTPTSVLWVDSEGRLDQGQTPHCIGFGGAQWGNTLPVDDKYVNADGHRIYYEAKVVDGEPKAEDGSSVHSLAKVLKADGRLNAYAWATTTAAITTYLQKYGPVVVGTDWYNDMFTPGAGAIIKPGGGIAGGHCYNLVGWSASGLDEYYTILNSWGAGWGVNGTVRIRVVDFATLLAAQGEALCAVELP